MKKRGYIVLPVASLVRAPWNYKRSDGRVTDALMKNMARHRQMAHADGVLQNVIVRAVGGKYEIVNGNHRLEVLRRLGIKTVLVFNLGTVSKEEAQRTAIETNETTFMDNRAMLADIVNGLRTTFGRSDIEATIPFTQYEYKMFDNMASDIAQQWMQTPVKRLKRGNVVQIAVIVHAKDAARTRAILAGILKEYKLTVPIDETVKRPTTPGRRPKGI